MAQESIQITTTPPLPGITLVQQINAALQALATDFSGASDPVALAGPFMTWADTGTLTIKRRNAAGTEWVIEGRLLCNHLPMFSSARVPTVDIGPIYIIGQGAAEWAGSKYKVLLPDIPSNDDIKWLGTPIGWVAFGFTYISGFDLPPTNDPRFRYIRLMAGDAYNAGVLINETVTGSAPTITASAVVNLPGSPYHGARVPLINTSRPFLRPGSDTGIITDSQNKEHIHLQNTGTALVDQSGTGWSYSAGAVNRRTGDATGASGGLEANPRYIGATYLMRIK